MEIEVNSSSSQSVEIGLNTVQSIETFVGGKGPKGPQGAQGFQGFQGDQGFQGAQGAQGVQGFQGPQGFQGFQGPQGVQGAQGVQGVQGFQGPQGFQGFQGPQGIQGVQGFQGPQGFQGFQGPQGVQGFQGPQGVQGFQGDQGVQGFQGAQGAQGSQGIRGFQGTQGSTATVPDQSIILDDISNLFNGVTTQFTISSSGTNFINSEIDSSARLLISVGGVVQQPDPSQSAGFYISGGTNRTTNPIKINFVEAPRARMAFFGVAIKSTNSPTTAFAPAGEPITYAIIFGV